MTDVLNNLKIEVFDHCTALEEEQADWIRDQERHLRS